MTLRLFIAIVVVCVFLFALWAFPELRALLKGLTRVFVKDMASTPEGANAIYEEKISQAQESYRIADNALKIASGRLSNAKADLEKLEIQKTQIEKRCESLVQAGQIEDAKVLSESRAEIISDIERQHQLIKAFATAEITAKEAHTMTEQNLRKLKKEQKDVVSNMKVKKELEKVYDDMNELKVTTGTDKMLESVRESNKDLNASVEGAKIIHENKLSTRMEKANQNAKKLESDDYLASLKKKYNK